MSAMTAGHGLTGSAMTGPAEAWKRQTFFDETGEESGTKRRRSQTANCSSKIVLLWGFVAVVEQRIFPRERMNAN
jgi:hypothetical protein